MTAVETFARWVPQLVTAANAGDPQLSVYVRQAMTGLQHWDLPIGIKVDEALVALLPKKLETPNRWLADWRIRKQSRATWGRLLWQVVCRSEGIASRAGCLALGRAPACDRKMQIQIVRLVPSIREFIRDDDNLPFSPKSLHDALKDVGLIKEDRRAWLTMASIVQDVSPIGVPVTMFILQPAPEPTLLTGATAHVHRQIRPHAHRESVTEDRGAEEGRAVSGARRRAGPRAVDLAPSETTGPGRR